MIKNADENVTPNLERSKKTAFTPINTKLVVIFLNNKLKNIIQRKSIKSHSVNNVGKLDLNNKQYQNSINIGKTINKLEESIKSPSKNQTQSKK